MIRTPRWSVTMVAALGLTLSASSADSLTVATFNLENYLLQPLGTRPVKSDTSRAAIRRALLDLRADLLALQEVGGTNALLELRDRLRQDGLDYPHWDWVGGYDTNIQVALLSRFPFTARRPHPNLNFLLQGRRYRTTRGLAEVDVSIPPHYAFTLLAVHLKSRRESGAAPQDDLRLEEARVLRRLIDDRLAADSDRNLVVLGDFNDVQDSRVMRTVRGRGRSSLVDTRPAERSTPRADSPANRGQARTRTVTWTHHYAKEDVYSRIDYILLSPGMAREWVANESYVLNRPDWGDASDHRPVVARFQTADR